MLSESQLSHYSVYMASLGCCPELFPDSEYVGRYGTGSYMDYAIPTEALEDEVFAAMMTEARKYLGLSLRLGRQLPKYVLRLLRLCVLGNQPLRRRMGLWTARRNPAVLSLHPHKHPAPRRFGLF